MAKSTTNLKDSKILVIVESPNKVSTISSILKKAGYKNMTVSASVGHIMELQNKKSTYKNTGININENFGMNLQVASDKTDVVRKLKKQADNSDLVYLMTDGDREGEAIAWSLIHFLKLPKKKYRRAITHEITPRAVINAIENPIELSDALVDAALSRLSIDKMIGYALSPIARIYVGAKSVGRCQSAGLKLIVDREKEIQNFVPVNYYELYLKFIKNNVNFKAKYIGTEKNPVDRLPSDFEVKKAIASCTGQYIIKDVITKQRYENPKPPFCTATFQAEAANKLGLKVKEAMNCAQKLFEGVNVAGEHIGLITYMRTDATDIAPEFLPTLKDYINDTYGNVYTAPRVAKVQDNAQQGHEALRIVDPTMTPDKLSQLINNELLVKVYNLIWQRTIASAMPAAVFSETTYTISNNDQLFSMVSKELLSPGYRQVYKFYDEQAGDIIKETFSKGEVLENTTLDPVLKQTTPPARYKEASFIKELQKREIGRPSTYATIVETVLSPTRGYCELDSGKYIVPTERGIQLSNFLDRSFSNIINLEYTKELEKDLDLIANEKLTKLDFMQTFYDTLEETIKANPEVTHADRNEESPNCPLCGAPMILRRSKFGKMFYGCSNYPQCKGLISIDNK